MIVSKPKNAGKICIDLNGPQGNAFYLLGVCKDLSKKLGREDWASIQKEATSGDYENLVEVLDGHFGNFVVFYR